MRNFKKIFAVLLAFMLVFSNVQITNAVEDIPTVSKDKIWTFNFANKITNIKNLQNDVFVKDSKGVKMKVVVALGKDKTSININAPAEGYKDGQTYSLFLNTNIGLVGTKYSNFIVNKFKIEEAKPTTPTTPTTSSSKISAPIGSVLCSSGLGFYMNSADGIFTYWMATNETGKTIKYYTVDISMYNAVGDPALSEITGSSKIQLKTVGPVLPNDPIVIYSIIAYSPVCSKIVINSIYLEYSDGTSETIKYGYSGTETLKKSK